MGRAAAGLYTGTPEIKGPPVLGWLRLAQGVYDALYELPSCRRGGAHEQQQPKPPASLASLLLPPRTNAMAVNGRSRRRRRSSGPTPPRASPSSPEHLRASQRVPQRSDEL